MQILSKDTRIKVEYNSEDIARYILVLCLLVAYYKLSITGGFLMRTYTSSPSSPQLGHYVHSASTKF